MMKRKLRFIIVFKLTINNNLDTRLIMIADNSLTLIFSTTAQHRLNNFSVKLKMVRDENLAKLTKCPNGELRTKRTRIPLLIFFT